MITPESVFFITGCSSGIGKVWSQSLLEKGYKVVLTARNIEDIAHLNDKYPTTSLCLELDVTKSNTIKFAVQKAIEKFGNIHVLINNAGVGYYGIMENIDVELAKYLFDVNVFGVVRVIKEVLPHMRREKKGFIINISSLSAFSSIYANGIYSASKAALNCLGESLTQEVKGLNIRCLTINLGETKSSFYKNSIVNTNVHSDYNTVILDLLENFQKNKYYNPQDTKKIIEKLVQYLENNANIPHKLFLGNETFEVIKPYIASIKEILSINIIKRDSK